MSLQLWIYQKYRVIKNKYINLIFTKLSIRIEAVRKSCITINFKTVSER